MKLVRGAWKLLVGIKDALVLIFMLLFFGLLFAALSSRPNASIRDGALVIDLAGTIVEQPTEVEGVECSPVVAIDDPRSEFFTWSGPARTLDEAARANRQWRSTGGGPGLAGLRP